MGAGTAGTQHLLRPETLSGLANLELVARAVVTGFLTGMHRSPFFGFSQEFREYRAYSEGDDPRFVDWNVYARTEVGWCLGPALGMIGAHAPPLTGRRA